MDVEIAPNGDKIITVCYKLKRTWTLCIAVDGAKKAIKTYAWFFKVAHARRNDIYQILNEWNKEISSVTFTVETTPTGSFVVAQTDFPTTMTRSLGKIVSNTADSLVKAMDELFDKIPSDLIVE